MVRPCERRRFVFLSARLRATRRPFAGYKPLPPTIFPAGDPSMVRTILFAFCLLTFCLSRLALADPPGPTQPATPQQVHQAVGRAIGYLQTESAAWLSQRKCAACHHVAMPLWALGEAERQGYAIDRTFVADTAEAALGGPEKMIASKLVSDP